MNLSPNTALLLFVTLYVSVDIAYILISRTVYDRAVRRIQGTPMVSRGVIGLLAAALAYILLGVGWLVIVPLLHERWKRALGSVLAGGMAGWFYASIVYGVFNLTLYVMLAGWDETIMLRDWWWGITWASIVGAAYGVYKKSR